MDLKYHQVIFGCQMNKSDAERLASLLEAFGIKKTDREEEANLIAVQSCSVRQSAIDRIHTRIAKWQSMQKIRDKDNPLVTLLTGCVLPKDKESFKKKFDLVIDTHNLHKDLTKKLPKIFPDILNNIKSKKLLLRNITCDDFFALEPNYSSKFQAYIPIQTGCNNFCTFCAVPYTKGREKYRPHKDIVQEIGKLVSMGYKEITLLGQNVNTYFDPTLKDAVGKRVKYREWSALTDFPRLLRIVNSIKGDFWLRFVTSNPWDMSLETIKAVRDCEKICEYIHLPLQSGSSRILKAMNRHHTKEQYLDLIEKIRSMIPGVAITTDIIVGFPGETEEDFLETVQVMEKVKYDMAYIARYSPRPGTIAERYMEDDVSFEEKKRREKILENILKKSALENNKRYVGKIVCVLIESCINKKESFVVGKTRTFKTVKLKVLNQKKAEDLIGKVVPVKITSAIEFGLEGEVSTF